MNAWFYVGAVLVLLGFAMVVISPWFILQPGTKRRPVLHWTIALLAFAIGLGLAFGNLPAASAGEHPSSSSSQAATGQSDQAMVKLIKDAAAHPEPCAKIVDASQVNSDGKVILTDPQLSWKASVAERKRYSGDSLSTPYPDQPDAAFRRWMQDICTQPYIGLSSGSLLANTPLGSGQTIGQIAGIGPADAANIKPEVIKAYGDNAQDRADYEEYAAKVVAVLNVAQIVGIEKAPVSIQYWHFANNGVPDSDGYNTVTIDTRENLPAVVVRYRDKGATCEFARIGINIVGPMPERFQPEGCATPSPTPSTTQNCNNCNNTPGCNQPCDTTTHPGCDKQPCGTTSSKTPCGCIDQTQAAQPVPSPAKQTEQVPTTAPPPAHTAPAPIVTGNPVPVDSGQPPQTTAVPTPKW